MSKSVCGCQGKTRSVSDEHLRRESKTPSEQSCWSTSEGGLESDASARVIETEGATERMLQCARSMQAGAV